MNRLTKTVLLGACLALVLPASAMAAKTATPTSLDFAPTPVDQTSASQAITVGITAGESFRNTSIYVDGCSPMGYCAFKVTSTTCPATFPAGDQSCVINVAFTPYDPTSLGVKTRSLNIGGDWPTIALRGSAISESSGKGGSKRKKCKKKGKKGAAAAKKCGKKRK